MNITKSPFALSAISLMVSGCTMPPTTESVSLESVISLQNTPIENLYAKPIIFSDQMKETCAGSFFEAFAKGIVGVGNKTNIIITLDKIPVLSVYYDDVTRSCTKSFVLEKDFARPELVSNINSAHELRVVFASNTKIVAAEKVLTSVKSLLSENSATKTLLSNPLPEKLLKVIDENLSNALSPSADYSTEFNLPNYEKGTRIEFSGVISGKKYHILSMILKTDSSVFFNKNPYQIYNSNITSYLMPKNDLLSIRNQRNAALLPGDASTISTDCKYLRDTYGSLLNTSDLHKLQESYLLVEHSGKLNIDIVGACLGTKIISVDNDLQLGELADQLRIVRSEIGTAFTERLNDGQWLKVLDPLASIYSEVGSVDFKNPTEYAQYKNKSTAHCHTLVTNNEVGFVQQIDDVMYYVLLEIDKAYTLAETAAGSSSVVKHITIRKSINENYTAIFGVNKCIGRYIALH